MIQPFTTARSPSSGPLPTRGLHEALRHNPYVGSFGYDHLLARTGLAPMTRAYIGQLEEKCPDHRSNPFVGTFRHAPSAAVRAQRRAAGANRGGGGESDNISGETVSRTGSVQSQGLKDILWEPSEMCSTSGKLILTQMQVARSIRFNSRRLDRSDLDAMRTAVFSSNLVPTESTPGDGNVVNMIGNYLTASSRGRCQTDCVGLNCSCGRDDGAEAPQCVICLEDFVDDDELRVLPCNHVFHRGCIDRWLLGEYSEDMCHTNLCPLCRSVAKVAGSGSDSGFGCKQHDSRPQHGQTPAPAAVRRRAATERRPSTPIQRVAEEVAATTARTINIPQWAFFSAGEALLQMDRSVDSGRTSGGTDSRRGGGTDATADRRTRRAATTTAIVATAAEQRGANRSRDSELGSMMPPPPPAPTVPPTCDE